MADIPKAGTYQISGQFAAGAGATSLELLVDKQTSYILRIPAGDWGHARRTSIGKIRVDQPGLHHLTLRTADPSRRRAVNVWQIDLERIFK